MAIIHRPGLLILDEPASGLDPEAREELAVLLRRLRDELGATLLVSSHILAELDAYAEAALILDQGRLVETTALDGALGAAVGAERLWVSLELAQPEQSEQAAKLLHDHEVERLDGGRLRIHAPAAPTARAGILTTLVNGGVAVAGFAPERESLQEVYVSKMRAARGATS